MLVAVGCVLAAGCAVACTADDPPIAARRDAVVETALADLGGRLADALARARSALAAVDPALDAAGDTDAARFAALEQVRAHGRLRGLQSDNPGGGLVWAGTPLEVRTGTEPPVPWAGSFTSGDVSWHAGPFLRAIVVTQTRVNGGSATASVAMEDESRTSPFGPTVEERWARALAVPGLRILPREALDRPAPTGVRRAAVLDPVRRTPVLAVEVDVPPDEELVADLDAHRRRAEGWVGLAGLAVFAAAAVAAIRRWVVRPTMRGLLWTALPLVVRHGLRLLDLHSRFPSLTADFQATDFARSGLLGWLANPLELLFTCVAALLAAVGAAQTLLSLPEGRGARTRLAMRGAGLALAATGVAGWMFLVESAAVHSRLDLFAPGMLLPTLPRALLLGALAAATAAAWTLCRAGLRRVVGTCGTALTARVGALVAAALVGYAAARLRTASPLPAFAPFLVPATAALVGRLRPGAARPGAPSRILLVSILSTALLFPVLWDASASASRAAIESRMTLLVGGPSVTASTLRARAAELVDDPVLVRQFRRYGGVESESDGIALYVWRKMGFASGRGDEGLVAVYDAEDRRFDRFGINVPPWHRLPDPRPDPERDGDPVTVVYVPFDRDHVAATILRARVRSTEGGRVGTVAIIVPDALTVEASGLVPRIAARPPGEEEEDPRGTSVDLCLLVDGRVALSTSAPPPAELPPPAALRGLTESVWTPPAAGDGPPWLAVPMGEHQVALVRAHERSFEDVVYGLARAVLVGVGVGAAVALVAFLVGLRHFRPRLQDKILGSYFAVSLVPLLFLGYANWRDAFARAEDDFRTRQREIARSSRREIEDVAPEVADSHESPLAHYADLRGQDYSVYSRGDLKGSSLRALADAEILPSRLDAAVYRAIELEGRDLVVRDEWIAGRKVRVAYTPFRTATGSATLSVPLLFDSDRAERRAAETGSVLLAAYLLAVVLVVVAGIYTARGLARRLATLSDATRRVAAGDLDSALPRGGRDEVGALVDAFNVMTADLKRLREQEALAERETAWRGMARQIAHEIKNPLTPMKLMLQQLVASARQDPRAAAQLIEPATKVVLEQIDTLARIASDFSAFARFPPRTIVDVDVNEELRSVAVLYSGGEGARERVETDLAADVPPVRWDRDELRRVFVNLVGNAVEAVDEAKGRVTAVLRTRRGRGPSGTRDGVEVVVTDDGVGIPPESMSRLFQPDFSTKTRGTGLGLAIVKRIVTDLGGDIRIESAPGRGTTVTVWMPAPAPAAPPPPSA